MKTLKGLSLFLVFFLILGSCGSGISLYEPGASPDSDSGDSNGSDLATAALLSAIFEEGEEEAVVDEGTPCPDGTVKMSAEFRSTTDVVDISTKVKALNVVAGNPKYMDYELKVVEKLKLLLVSNLNDDETLSEILKIIVSKLSDKEYELLKRLVEKASERAFDTPEKLEKQALYTCSCEQKYVEKEAEGEVIKYCPQDLVYNFKIAMDDQKLSQADRCKKGEEALRIIDRAASGCVESFGLKEHFANMCLRSCEDNYNTFLKYIGAVVRPGDAYCSEAAAVGTKTKDSGLCSRELVDKMAKIYAERCTVSPVCKEITLKFDEVYSKVGCSELGTLEKIKGDAGANGCDTTKMSTIIKQCSAEPAICIERNKTFDEIYAKSGCFALQELKDVMLMAEKEACVDSVPIMSATIKQCGSEICINYAKQFQDIYNKEGCGGAISLQNIFYEADKNLCDTSEMKTTLELCKK